MRYTDVYSIFWIFCLKWGINWSSNKRNLLKANTFCVAKRTLYEIRRMYHFMVVVFSSCALLENCSLVWWYKIKIFYSFHVRILKLQKEANYFWCISREDCKWNDVGGMETKCSIQYSAVHNFIRLSQRTLLPTALDTFNKTSARKSFSNQTKQFKSPFSKVVKFMVLNSGF